MLSSYLIRKTKRTIELYKGQNSAKIAMALVDKCSFLTKP